MKQIALLGAMLYYAATAIAQQPIRIKVIDRSNQQAVSGATIRYERKSYSTDQNGFCQLNCTGTGTITVSHVGYAPYSVALNHCEDRTIELDIYASNLEYVEITATSSKNKSLLYQPASISKMGLTEIKRGQGLFFDDAIQTNVPGVQMNRRTVSGGQQLNIRGYGNGARGTRGANSNFDGQGYKVYLNGIPVTDAEGITTMDDIDFGSIGSAEITKGPAGTLYGQAIAGAVNLKTIAPEKGKTTIGQEVQLGNYGLRRLTTSFQSADDRNAILLNYGNQSSDGFAWHNRSKKDFLNFSYATKPSDKQSVSTYLGYSDSYDERLGELTPTQWAANDYSGNIEYLKRNAHSHVISFRAGITHSYALSRSITNTTTLFGTGFRSDVSSAGGWTDKTSINYGLRSSFDVRLNLSKDVTLIGLNGIEIQRQDAQTIGYSMKQNPSDTTTTSGWNFSKPFWVINATTSNVAFVTSPTLVFSQWSVHFPKDLSLTAGLSYNQQRIQLNDRFNAATATRPADFDTTYTHMLSPSLSLNKVFRKEVSAYVSYSSGYKAPVSSYFFITTPTVTNPPIPATARVNGALKPEKGSQLEIGSKGALFNNRLQFQLALFHTRFSNKMTSVSVPLNNTATAYSYVVNGGTQTHNGLELSLKHTLLQNNDGFVRSLTPFLNFAYSNFEYGKDFRFITGSTVATLDTFRYGGLPVFGTPKITNSIGVDADFKFGGYASLSSLYKDGFSYAMEKVSNAPKTFAVRNAGSYNLINLKLGYRTMLSQQWQLDASFGINNLTGTKYPLMVFVNQLPDAFIPAPPKAVWFGGFSLKYRIQRKQTDNR